MNVSLAIFALGLLFFTAHLFTALFEKARIPDVLPLTAVGILLGPVFGVVRVADFGMAGPVLTMIALIAILFEGGTDLRLYLIRSALREVLALSLSMFAGTVLVTTLLTKYLLGVEWGVALVIGTIAGNISPAVVLPMIRSLKLRGRSHTVMFLETAVSDVLCIVISLAVFDALELGNLHAGRIALTICTSFVFAALLGVTGAFMWAEILHRVRRFPNTLFTTFAYLFVLFGAAESLHISGAITALAFGVAIANLAHFPVRKILGLRPTAFRGFSKIEKVFFSEAVFALKTFFFIYLGIALEFSHLRVFSVGILITLIIYAFRPGLVRAIMPKKTTFRRDAALMSTLAPKGLAAAVLALLAVERGLPGASIIQDIIFSMILFSIILSAALIFMLEKTPLARNFGEFFKVFPQDPRAAARDKASRESQTAPEVPSGNPPDIPHGAG